MSDSIAFFGLLAFLVTAAIWDVRTEKVPNWLTYPAMAVGLFFWTLSGYLGHLPGHNATPGFDAAAQGFFFSAAAMAAGVLPFALIFFLGGLGGGDVKVMGVVGAICGRWELVFHTTVYSLALASVIALVIMVRKGIIARTLKRILAAALSAVSGVKTDLSTDTERIPFAIAVLGGGAVAGAEYMLRIVKFPWTS